MKKTIGVIGQGFVGGSVTEGLASTYYVYACDISGKFSQSATSTTQDLATLVQVAENEVSFSGVYFVCLPTPMKSNGECDVSIVESVLTQLSKIPGQRIAVVKSTIPPGSTACWNEMFANTGLTVVFNPEFLTEANAVEDFKNQNRIIVGGPRPASGIVKQIFQAAFPKVPIIKTSSTIAEMIKYVTNTFLATKVSFANEIFQVCKQLNIDYDKVIEYAKYDDRLGYSHWSVPGPMALDDNTNKPAFGFGGSCFPKDLNALMFLAQSLGITPHVLNGVWQKNLEVRPQKDWEQLKGRAISISKVEDED
tara:strand:+ start:4966 stop:5889 length:924 start_codon:yes stop_codon:yes gene_type:complete